MRIVITGLASEVRAGAELARQTYVVFRESWSRRRPDATESDPVTVHLTAYLPGGTGEKS